MIISDLVHPFPVVFLFIMIHKIDSFLIQIYRYSFMPTSVEFLWEILKTININE